MRTAKSYVTMTSNHAWMYATCRSESETNVTPRLDFYHCVGSNNSELIAGEGCHVSPPSSTLTRFVCPGLELCVLTRHIFRRKQWQIDEHCRDCFPDSVHPRASPRRLAATWTRDPGPDRAVIGPHVHMQEEGRIPGFGTYTLLEYNLRSFWGDPCRVRAVDVGWPDCELASVIVDDLMSISNGILSCYGHTGGTA